MSKRENEQGTVVVRVLIKNNGTVGKVEIKSSSGFFRIDQAVVDTAVTWRCNPENKGGKPVDS
jgi:protein TonB